MMIYPFCCDLETLQGSFLSWYTMEYNIIIMLKKLYIFIIISTSTRPITFYSPHQKVDVHQYFQSPATPQSVAISWVFLISYKIELWFCHSEDEIS